VPDSAVPKIREVFGGATNAETIANVRDFLLPLLRRRVLEDLLGQQRATDEVTVNTNQGVVIAALDTEWP